MSSQYTTEPPPTATVLLKTTAGPLTLSLFAQQTPLTSRNFLQHCIDGTYNNTIFHRVAPGFVIQTGDPTGTGEGGTNIYEDGDQSSEFYGEAWGKYLRLPEERYGERIVLGDEVHSRLKFNRRGLVGMARMTERRDGSGMGQYGSQWFITLGDCRTELDGRCTMFGRVEGEGVYNVMKIAGGEVVLGSERPVFPERVLGVEVLEWPEGEVWRRIKRRERVAERIVQEIEKGRKKEKAGKKKGGKTLLSFGGDGEDEDDVGVAVRPKQAKFNTNLIEGPPAKDEEDSKSASKTTMRNSAPAPSKRRKSPSSAPASRRSPEPGPKRRKPSFHEPTTQLPIRDPESPSRSPTPEVPSQRRISNHKSATALEAEIATLKASMRRDIAPVPEQKQKLSALEKMIPATSSRGRKRPRPGETGSEDKSSLKMLDAFKARLEKADEAKSSSKDDQTTTKDESSKSQPNGTSAAQDNDEEAALCDLHFIANCQSCSDWADNADVTKDEEEEKDRTFMSHALTFDKDRLGKDLSWKQKNEEELVVIDPREREKELGIKDNGKRKETYKERGMRKGGRGDERRRGDRR